MLKNFKLICTAIGLVAVLVMGLAMPGATQQNPLSRQGVVDAVNSAVAATLTAAEGELLDTNAVTFVSDIFATYTYIPIAKESRSAQRLIEEVCSGKYSAPILLGAMLADRFPDPDLPQGIRGFFYVYLTPEGVLQLVTQGGDVAFKIKGHITCSSVDLGKLPWHLTLDLDFGPPVLTPLLDKGGNCSNNVRMADAKLASCTVRAMCKSFKIFGITVWESCVDVIVCDNGTIIKP